MNLRARWLAPVLLLALGGCQAPTEAAPQLRLVPGLVDWQSETTRPIPEHVTVPDFGGGVLMVESGEYAFVGETAHGEATFEGAVVFDATREEPPSASGRGHYAIEVGGTLYESPTLATVAAVLPDAGEGGETYLVLGGFELGTDALGREVASALWAMVPVSDVAPGATVVLDGERTLAYFASGSAESESPELVAITASGALTFGTDLPASLDVGASLSASLEGEFGQVDVSAIEPDPEPTFDPTGIVAGDYTLVLATGDAEIYCDGALSGRESAFAGLGPDAFGLSGGAVTASSADVRSITLSGPAIEASFATPVLDASWQDDALFYVGFADGTGASIGGATRVGTFAFLAPSDDGGDRSMFVGAVFAADPSSPDAGQCQIGWEASLVR